MSQKPENSVTCVYVVSSVFPLDLEDLLLECCFGILCQDGLFGPVMNHQDPKTRVH